MSNINVSIGFDPQQNKKYLLINDTPYPLDTVFKKGEHQGITFDEHFWRKVYCGDVNKDGCPMDILKKPYNIGTPKIK